MIDNINAFKMSLKNQAWFDLIDRLHSSKKYTLQQVVMFDSIHTVLIRNFIDGGTIRFDKYEFGDGDVNDWYKDLYTNSRDKTTCLQICYDKGDYHFEADVFPEHFEASLVNKNTGYSARILNNITELDRFIKMAKDITTINFGGNQ